MFGSLRLPFTLLLLGVVWISSSSAAKKSPFAIQRATGALLLHDKNKMMNNHLEHRKNVPASTTTTTDLLSESARSSSAHAAAADAGSVVEYSSDYDDNDDDNVALLVEEHHHHHHDQHGPLLLGIRGGAVASAILHRVKVGFYFGLWYALNVFYNIINKQVLNVLPAPLLVGSIQFGVGALYVVSLWMLRIRPHPKLNGNKARHAVRTVGFWHCVGQLLSMVSLGAGPVSFTHIVKALEPFFSALVSALYFGVWMHPVVYATLLPVVGGVGYACLKEKSFSWLAFGTAMGSNVAFALRAVLSKIAMTSDSGVHGEENSLGTNLSAPNVFGLVTCSAFWISLPLALASEGSSFFRSAGITVDPETLAQLELPSLWQSAVEASEQGQVGLIRSIIFSGLFHYWNNEVMYLALSNVHPVTLAVGNTMKRVFIMVASVMVFRNQISLQAGIGSAIGIAGVLLYSLTKQHYEQLAKKQQQQVSLQQPNNKRGVQSKQPAAAAGGKVARKKTVGRS